MHVPRWLGLALVALAAFGGNMGLLRGGAAPTPGGLPRPSSPDRAAGPGWLSFNELLALAASVGFSAAAAEKAARIAWRESRGNPRAAAIVVVPKPGNLPERSFGLWQVNTLASPQYDETQLLDPAYNARAAFELSKGGTNWRPWNLR
jgi:hypothetical protein